MRVRKLQPGLAFRPLYPLTTSIEHFSLLLISIFPYLSLTPNTAVYEWCGEETIIYLAD